MKQSIYDRIPMIATDDLKQLQELWSGLCSDRPTPRRHDYWGKCLLRASLELERRAARTTPPQGKLYAHGRTTATRA